MGPGEWCAIIDAISNLGRIQDLVKGGSDKPMP